MTAYRRHDVLAWPSTYEGFGMVLLEAMSQRLPVVATPVGCARVAGRIRTDRTRRVAARRGGPGAQAWPGCSTIPRSRGDARTRVREGPALHVVPDRRATRSMSTRRALAESAQWPAVTERISVGIATRNRRGSLLRCLASLALIEDMIDEVLVVDDTSDEPLGDLGAEVPPAIARKLRVIVQPGRQGPIVASNTTVRLARNECVLLMDDDAYVIDAAAIRRGVDVFSRHREVGAVAFAQAEADGAAWPAAMQPATATRACYVPGVHRFRAPAAPQRVPRARRVSGAAALLRRGEGLLPAAAECRLRGRLRA